MMSVSENSVRRPDEMPKGPAQARTQTMRVMVFGKATDGIEESAPPTKEAFAAMDQFTEELVKAGIMVAGAGLQNNAPMVRAARSSTGRSPRPASWSPAS
jgi:hypothetical protein